MSKKYEPVRASGYIEIEGEQKVYTIDNSQLDRIEQKLDRLLGILENGDLSTSFEREFIATSKQISNEIDRRLKENLRKSRTV